MKKLLGVSIAAMLAVTPMMANADSAVNARGVTTVTNNDVATNKNIATTSYVKGAFNVLATEVSNIGDDIAITQGTNETLNNINTTDSIATNVKTLDAKMGDVNTLASAANNGTILKQNNTATSAADSLTSAVVAINNALATATNDATVGAGSHNYVVAGATGASNLVELDTAIGQLDTNATHYHIGTMGTTSNDKTVASNLEALDKQIGAITEGAYAHIANNATVSANLTTLNTAVVANDTAIGHLNAGDSDSLSVDYKVKNNARNAAFTPTATGLSSTTLQAAINEVQTHLNSANTDAALLQGHYYDYQDDAQNNIEKDTIAGAIQKVDAQVYTNTGAIATINAKQIQLYGDWTNPDTSTTTVTISQLP